MCGNKEKFRRMFEVGKGVVMYRKTFEVFRRRFRAVEVKLVL